MIRASLGLQKVKLCNADQTTRQEVNLGDLSKGCNGHRLVSIMASLHTSRHVKKEFKAQRLPLAKHGRGSCGGGDLRMERPNRAGFPMGTNYGPRLTPARTRRRARPLETSNRPGQFDKTRGGTYAMMDPVPWTCLRLVSPLCIAGTPRSTELVERELLIRLDS